MKKIVVIGPESTGKSSLCEQLAAHYNTLWVKEHAREYLRLHGSKYTYEQLWQIAQGQLIAEDQAAALLSQTHPLAPLIIDTDMYVMKVWSEIVFNQCDNRILNYIAGRQYHLYLLCNTDLPWVQDELREYPDLKSRQKIFEFYNEAMQQQPTPWVIIQGNYKQRFNTAVNSIDELMKTPDKLLQ